jgi:hypothetical protein
MPITAREEGADDDASILPPNIPFTVAEAAAMLKALLTVRPETGAVLSIFVMCDIIGRSMTNRA